MAIQNARILIRRGDEADFNANNMQPGEWALSTDEKIVRICVSPGLCIRMATYDAFEADMAKIEAILADCETIEEAVTAIQSEINAKEVAFESYVQQAKGYSETAAAEASKATTEANRAENEADRAKEEADRASSVVNIGIATTEKAGIVKPDGTTITVDEYGTLRTNGTTNYNDLTNKPTINNVTLSGNKSLNDLGITTADSKDNTATFTQASTRENIASTEKHAILFGKIKKWFSDLKPHAFVAPITNLLTTVAGSALDATMGNELNNKITANADAIKEVNSNLKITLIPSSKTLKEWLDENINETNVPADGKYHYILAGTSEGNYVVSSICIGSTKIYSGIIHPSTNASTRDFYQYSKVAEDSAVLKEIGSLAPRLLWSGSSTINDIINLEEDLSTFNEIVFYLNGGIALSYKPIRIGTLIKTSTIATSDSGTVPLMFTTTFTKNSNTQLVMKALTAHQLSSGAWSEIPNAENYKITQIYGLK